MCGPDQDSVWSDPRNKRSSPVPEHCRKANQIDTSDANDLNTRTHHDSSRRKLTKFRLYRRRRTHTTTHRQKWIGSDNALGSPRLKAAFSLRSCGEQQRP